MVIVETKVFSRILEDYLDDEGFRELQSMLIEYPEAGDCIPGSGGLRKLRWSAGGGKGKRGGLRIIYHYVHVRSLLLFLFVYKKTQQEDLTPEQIKILKRTVDKELNTIIYKT